MNWLRGIHQTWTKSLCSGEAGAAMLTTIPAAALGAVLLAVTAPALSTSSAADRVWRIGFLDLSPLPTDPAAGNLPPFLNGMDELGHTENRDFVITARYADADFARVPRLAQELIDSGVDLIVTVGTPTTVAAKKATTAIPIVMTGTESPIEHGLIASFPHPGGNVTGLTHQPDPLFWQKGLQLLKQAVPGMSRVGVFATAPPLTSDVAGVTTFGYRFDQVRSVADLDPIFAKAHEDQIDGAFIFPDFVIGKYGNEISQFITSNHLPAMTQNKNLLERGALLYYYTDFAALRRRAASYVDKIMKGAKPADLPVEQPSRFEFIINLRTARNLGLTMPPSLTGFADGLIE
jgi:putative tryptophan/tyrosine transport system substrate-binding protein